MDIGEPQTSRWRWIWHPGCLQEEWESYCWQRQKPFGGIKFSMAQDFVLAKSNRIFCNTSKWQWKKGKEEQKGVKLHLLVEFAMWGNSVNQLRKQSQVLITCDCMIVLLPYGGLIRNRAIPCCYDKSCSVIHFFARHQPISIDFLSAPPAEMCNLWQGAQQSANYHFFLQLQPMGVRAH